MSVRTGIINYSQTSFNYQDVRSNTTLNRNALTVEEALGIPLQPNTSIPSPYTSKGFIAFDEAGNVPMFSNGTSWIDFGVGNVSSITAGTGLTATPSNPITTSGTISITNTTVTPGSYTLSSITVNAQGQLTAASSGSVNAGTGISITGTASAPIVNIANTSVTAGSYTYTSITVNAQGQLTAASSGTSPVTSVTAGTGISITGTASVPIINIANTTVTAGSYTYTSITVNAQGQLTAASSGATPLTTVITDASLIGNGTGGSPLGLATQTSAGTYSNPILTVNNRGVITVAVTTTGLNADWISTQSVTGSGSPQNVTTTTLDPNYTTILNNITSGGVYTATQSGLYFLSVTITNDGGGVGDTIADVQIVKTDSLATNHAIAWAGVNLPGLGAQNQAWSAATVTSLTASTSSIQFQFTSGNNLSSFTGHASVIYIG